MVEVEQTHLEHASVRGINWGEIAIAGCLRLSVGIDVGFIGGGGYEDLLACHFRGDNVIF